MFCCFTYNNFNNEYWDDKTFVLFLLSTWLSFSIRFLVKMNEYSHNIIIMNYATMYFFINTFFYLSRKKTSTGETISYNVCAWLNTKISYKITAMPIYFFNIWLNSFVKLIIPKFFSGLGPSMDSRMWDIICLACSLMYNKQPRASYYMFNG